MFSKCTYAQPSTIPEVDNVHDVVNYLREFQKQCIIVPTDKASNNIIVVFRHIIFKH